MGPMNRRALIGALPVCAASGVAIMAIPAMVREPDPIFAAVANMMAASERHHAIWDEWDGRPEVRRNPDWIARRDAAFEDWKAKAMVMAATVPTSAAGLAALLALIEEDVEAGDSIWQVEALRSAASAAKRFAGEGA